MKKTEAELRETQAILKTAMDISQAGSIAIADAPGGALRHVNDAGLLIRGGDRRSIVKLPAHRAGLPGKEEFCGGSTGGRKIAGNGGKCAMTRNDDRPKKPARSASPRQALRRQAEAFARGKAARSQENSEAMSPEEARRTLHEQQMHQIELELQNDERRRTQAELDAARARYFDLYDLAPVGYVTLSEKGLILEANLRAANLLGAAKNRLVKRPLTRFILPEDQDIYHRNHKLLAETPSPNSGQAGAPEVCELRLVRKDGARCWVRLDMTAVPAADGAPVCRVAMSDITERKRAERYQVLTAEILGIMNDTSDLADTINRILAAINRELGLAAVGIRLRDGDDFPYFVQDGFSPDFLLTENPLTVHTQDGRICRDEHGNIRLECTCGLVISGKTDPANPLFTPGGSFWTNDSLPLLNLPADQDPRLHPRNRCIHEGFRSVALIPIRVKREIVGLLQLNDREKGYFTIEMIRFFEGLTSSIGIALTRKQAEEALRKTYDELDLRVKLRTADLATVNEELRKQKVLLESIFSNVSFLVAYMDSRFTVTWVNRAFAEGNGHAPEYFQGRNYFDLCPGEETEAIFRKAVETGEPYLTFRRSFPYAQSQERRKSYWDWSLVPVKGMDGEVEALVLCQVNVTERTLAENKVMVSNAEMRMVLDGISEPMFLLDPTMRVQRLNHAAKEYYGLDRFTDAIGKRCFELPGNSGPCKGCERPFTSLGGYTGSFERKSPVNPERLEQIVVCRVTYTSNSEESTLIRISDVTQAKALQNQLIRSEKLASLGLLVSGIAHEINNPSTFITFNLPILRDYLDILLPQTDAFAREHPDFNPFGMSYEDFKKDLLSLIDNIKHGSDRINATVKQLKAFSQKRENIQFYRVDLSKTIEKAATLCRSELKKRVKHFDVSIPGEGMYCFTDPEAIEQVLVNLLINAAYASDKKDSRVRLNVLQGVTPSVQCIIEVSDNGCGMDEKTKKRIFDPFFTTKSPAQGTGLGLYVCHSLIDGIGGKIDVESKPGRGTTFRIILVKPDREQMRDVAANPA